jgi:hypothetical protein
MSEATLTANAQFYEIPLSASPQTMGISLSGTTYNLRFLFRDSQGAYPNILPCGWVVDISDQNNNLLVGAVPLITGANLLEQFAYIGIDGGLYVAVDGTVDATPTYDQLGTVGHLYYVPN